MPHSPLSARSALGGIAGALLLFLPAATSADGPATPRVFERTPPPAYAAPPVFRERLPSNAIAYLRVPNLWGLLGARKGGRMDDALAAEPFADALDRVRRGVARDVLGEVPQELSATVELLLGRATSPLEVLLTAPPQGGPPFPEALLALKTDFADVDEFARWLERLVDEVPQLTLAVPPNEDGMALLEANGSAIPLMLEPTDRLLTVLLHAAGNADMMLERLVALNESPQHRMLPFEARLDSAGQGLFLWVDPAAAISLVGALAGPQQVAPLVSAGLEQATGLAIGLGTAGGQQRLRVELEMPRVGFRMLVPTVGPLDGLRVAGDPSLLAQVALPTRQDFNLLELMALDTADADGRDQYARFKAQFAEVVGMPLAGLLDVFGQQIILVSDDAGTYLAVKLRDREAFDALLGRLSTVEGASMRSREIAGREMHALTLPSTLELVELLDELDAVNPAGLPPLAMRYMSLRSHVYWTHSGDYILLADAPQTLIDREYADQRPAAGEWLEQAQRSSGDGKLVHVSARLDDIGRAMYRYNLLMLSALGEFAGAPVDLFDMPTATELGIARDTRYSAGISSTDTGLALEVSYDYNPLEPLLAMYGSSSIAVAGVLAAVAIPAYQDYTVRAKVSEGGALAAPFRLEIATFAMSEGRLPTSKVDISQLGLGEPHEYAGNYVASVHVEAGSGDVVVIYNAIGSAVPKGAELRYTPRLIGSGIDWETSGSMPAKYLPKG